MGVNEIMLQKLKAELELDPRRVAAVQKGLPETISRFLQAPIDSLAISIR